MQTSIVCPACEQGHWEATGPSGRPTRGVRTCDQCGAVAAISRHGVRVKTLHQFQHAGTSLRGQRNLSDWARRRLVVAPDDSSIGCACCGKPTDLLAGIDGRIELDERVFIDVQVGETFDHVANLFVPTIERRQIPRRLRGIICPRCAIKYGAQPVYIPKGPQGSIKVKPKHFNSKTQRLAADVGEVATERARRNLLDQGWDEREAALLAGEATSLDGANWGHTGQGGWMGADPFDPFGALDSAIDDALATRRLVEFWPAGSWRIIATFPRLTARRSRVPVTVIQARKQRGLRSQLVIIGGEIRHVLPVIADWTGRNRHPAPFVWARGPSSPPCRVPL